MTNKIQVISTNVDVSYLSKHKNTKKKVNRKSLAFWKRHAIEFLRTTGFHGYRYIAMNSEPIISRILWSVAVFVCLVVAIALVLLAWNWITLNPTITVIESTHYPIWKFPYPAVTICPVNILKRSLIKTNLRTLNMPENMTVEEIADTLKSGTVLLGNLHVDDETAQRFKRIQNVININNITILEFMDMIRPTCSDMLTRCSWKGSPTRCSSLFQDIKTASGFCCSFNYYAAKKIDDSQKKTFFVPKKPRKVAGCGYQTALTILLNISPDEYYTTVHGIYGYKIMVHYSYDYPDDNAAVKFIDRTTENFLAVAPEMTYSTEGIYSFSAAKRKCALPKEVTLRNFVRYTYTNCLVECRRKFVHEMCGCVPFFLPNNGSQAVCNFTDVTCPYRANTIYYSASPHLGEKSCNCLPDCQNFVYPLEMSTGKLVPTNEYNSFSVFKDITISNHSLTHVYFNDLVTTRYRKNVFMNWHNVLASFGGLLGLFIGFSMVSGFELVYFFTIRVFFDAVHIDKEIETNNNSTWNEKQQITPKGNKVDVISLSNKDDHVYNFKSKNLY